MKSAEDQSLKSSFRTDGENYHLNLTVKKSWLRNAIAILLLLSMLPTVYEAVSDAGHHFGHWWYGNAADHPG